MIFIVGSVLYWCGSYDEGKQDDYKSLLVRMSSFCMCSSVEFGLSGILVTRFGTMLFLAGEGCSLSAGPKIVLTQV